MYSEGKNLFTFFFIESICPCKRLQNLGRNKSIETERSQVYYTLTYSILDSFSLAKNNTL